MDTPGSTVPHRACLDQYIQLRAYSGPPDVNYLRILTLHISVHPQEHA
jgi:hypothetical protein